MINQLMKIQNRKNLIFLFFLPFLALTGVDFLPTLFSTTVAICAAAVLAEAAAEAAKLFFFLIEAVVVVTELELSTEINEMSDLSDLVDESVSRLRRFFSLSRLLLST